ncbi:MAG: hypothetical protein ACR2HG_07740 [Pyrinomonadaceae bacterium]
MIHKITLSKYEVSEDGKEHNEKFDSLEQAIEKMPKGKTLIAIYDIWFNDRTAVNQKEILEFAEIANLNQQEIVELIKQKIVDKYNQ